MCNGIEWNVVIVGIYFTCLEAVFHFLYTLFWRTQINEIRVEISFLFDISKLLVAYKHTYFAQRNRMKCGHSRNLFYVSRSCFSFYLHTFVTHLNNWNTRWDFIFIRHLKTTCGIYFAQRNRMKCGHSRNLFYVSRTCFSFYLHTFVTHLNNWNTRWDFIFFDENYLWHINTLILCNGIEWNVVIVGIYFTCLEAVFHFIYTLLWRT